MVIYEIIDQNVVSGTDLQYRPLETKYKIQLSWATQAIISDDRLICIDLVLCDQVDMTGAACEWPPCNAFAPTPPWGWDEDEEAGWE